MRSQHEQVLLGARIPAELKQRLNRYCLAHGIKMNYLITEAIKEKLLEISQDNEDLLTAEGRMKNPKFVSQKEFDKYLLHRGIKP